MSVGWTIEGFHHVQLGMPPGREGDAEAFYVGRLGFERIAKPPHLEARGGCWFRAGAVELHLGLDREIRPPARAHPALRVHGLEVLRASLEAAQVPIEDDSPLDGYDRWYIRDPFGNRLELIEER